jgi:hypothetical protein
MRVREDRSEGPWILTLLLLLAAIALKAVLLFLHTQ